MRGRRWWALLVLVMLVIGRRYCGHEELRVATFNIEDYPKSPVQEAGIFPLIQSLGASAVAVQEITQPTRFAMLANATLGKSWRFVYPEKGPSHMLGVLYDSDELRLLGTRVYRELELDGGGKPAFEARFKPKSGAPLRVIVVHLKAGGENAEIRARQLIALRPIMVDAKKSKDRVVLLGDFNATGDRDRIAIKDLAGTAKLEWSSEKVKCTSYWNRNDGCVGTPLDHVLSTMKEGARARGPCEVDGCARADRCPVYVEHISDHCPVTIDVD